MLKVVKKDEHIKQVLRDTKEWYQEIPHDDACLVLLGKDGNDPLTRILRVDDSVSLYYRKKERMYEKEMKFSNLSNTLIEFFMTQSEITLLHVTESFYFVEPFFQKPIDPNMTPSIVGFPIYDEEQLLGIIILYTSLLEIHHLQEKILRQNKVVAKLLKQAILLDQVLPSELSEFKQMISKSNHLALTNDERELVYVTIDLQELLNLPKQLVQTSVFQSHQKGLKTYEMLFQDEVKLGDVTLSIYQFVPKELSTISKKVILEDIEPTVLRAQNEKQKISVVIYRIISNPKHLLFLSYQEQKELYDDVTKYIQDQFMPFASIGEWLSKGRIVIVEKTIDERKIKSAVDAIKSYVANHLSNQYHTYSVQIGVIRFGKEAKLTNDYFTPIDVFFDALSTNTLFFDEELVKQKLRLQVVKQVVPQTIKAIKSIKERQVIHSITNQSEMVYLEPIHEHLAKDQLFTKELELQYAKKCLSLIECKSNQKVIVSIPVSSLVDDTFYIFMKDWLYKKQIRGNQLHILMSQDQLNGSISVNKLDRYHQLGIEFVVKLQFIDPSMVSKIKYSWIMIDMRTVAQSLLDPIQKAMMQATITILLDQTIHIIFSDVTEESQTLVPKERTVYYIKNNA